MPALELLSLVTHHIALQRNELLLHGAPIDDHIYIMEDGALRVYIMTEEKEQNVRFAYPGEIFGFIDSFFTGQPSQYYIEALRQTRLGVIPKKKLMEFVQSSAEHLQQWNERLVQLLLGCLEREIDLLTDSPEERVQRVLQRSPRLFQEIPLKYIANYLRMTPETLSRVRKS